MIVIGIAGGSGTGKSTIASHLAQRFGGVHIDADRVAHAILADDPDVVARIRTEIGPDVFDAEGRIDRRALGRRVFGDPVLLARLNAIVHPVVMERCAVAVREARASGAAVAAVDAALLLDVPMPFRVDLLIALTGDRETRFRRIMAKGGWSEAEVRARLDRQDGLEKHFYKADVVIDTGRDLATVLRDIDARVATVMDSEIS
jgi:dephospho-CoA kinase